MDSIVVRDYTLDHEWDRHTDYPRVTLSPYSSHVFENDMLGFFIKLARYKFACRLIKTGEFNCEPHPFVGINYLAREPRGFAIERHDKRDCFTDGWVISTIHIAPAEAQVRETICRSGAIPCAFQEITVPAVLAALVGHSIKSYSSVSWASSLLFAMLA